MYNISKICDNVQQQRTTKCATADRWDQQGCKCTSNCFPVNASERELVEGASCSNIQNDNVKERIAALEEEGRRMEERIALLEFASLGCAAVSPSDVSVHGQDPSTDGVANRCLDVDAKEHSQMSQLAQMLETLRNEVVMKLESGLKKLEHMEERIGAMEKVVQVQVNQNQRLSQTPLTTYPQNLQEASLSSVLVRAKGSPRAISTCTEETCQGTASAALPTSLRPQKPKIAAPVPHHAGHSATKGLAERR